MSFGSNSMFQTLRRALVREPNDSFGNADPAEWGYSSQPDLDEARREHRGLVKQLEFAGVEVVYHSAAGPGLADSIFVYDPVLMTPAGAVILRMGKVGRLAERDLIRSCLEQLQIPIVGRIEAPGMIEGGDLLWLDSRTLFAGLGFRTNPSGVEQLNGILQPQGIAVKACQLPYHKGPESCLHLLSLISMLDHNLAVIHRPLLPVPFFQTLQERKIECVCIPEEEFPTQASNVLALGPRKLLMLEENVETIRRLEASGCQVSTYRGKEISHKAEGGPTCLVSPLWRSSMQNAD